MLPDLTARPRWYILDGREPIVAASVAEWAQWMSHHPRERWVACTHVGALTVVTRFTGMDRALLPGAPPVLFESWATDGLVEIPCGSAATWADALACHERAVAARQPSNPPPYPAGHRVRLMRRAWAVLRRVLPHRTAPFFSLRSTRVPPTTKEVPSCPRES